MDKKTKNLKGENVSPTESDEPDLKELIAEEILLRQMEARIAKREATEKLRRESQGEN
ncbi:hypothetical protein SAMN05660652_03562 [Propionivibrio dicarboxylicus]|uniref:Uncharacterized protein n=1 Tax=Propionivibrio dicarboxylicus TaxID=83767 RepID=A0A1G8L751_9RHOO|nr:hypothetical protein SAMN05660652_03562 [Propionivibrio dicarboxylicus]